MGVQVREKVKGSGVWWVFINHNGQRKAKQVGDKKAAKEIAAKIQLRLAAGTFEVEKKPVPTFGELAKEWITTIVPATVKESTAEDYALILRRHVLPVFKSKPIDSITRRDVRSFLFAKAKALSVAKAKHCKSVMSGVFRVAVEGEIIPGNPAKEIGKIGANAPQAEEINPFTADELVLLLEVFAEKWPAYHPLVLCLARSGLRIGEALALRWEDLDFRQRVIHVRRAWHRERVILPKSGKTRKVDMSPQLAEALQAQQTKMKRVTLAQGWGEVPAWVFTEDGKRPLAYQPFAKAWDKAQAQVGIMRRRIHDLRHTYASLRVAKGDNLADVSKQLGHHSVKFTLDAYYHWIPGQAKGEVDGLDNLTSHRVIPHFSEQPAATQAQPAPNGKDLAGGQVLVIAGGGDRI